MLLKCAWISDPFVICFTRYTPSGQAAWDCVTNLVRNFAYNTSGKPREGSGGPTCNLWTHLLEMSEDNDG
jgi:hypothetical protein